MKKTEVLVVDDERDTCELLELALARQGMQVTTCTTAADALEKLASHDFDVVLTDLTMPETSGLEVCERVLALRPDVPVVLVTGHATLETAMGAIRAGAYDFVIKPIESKTLGVVVSRAVQHHRLRVQIKLLRAARDANQSLIVGGSPAMRKVADLIERVGDSDASVLIHGETGAGKELVARAVHNKSNRRDGPFVAINCAAVPHSLLESELFGHARGAFTDAKSTRIGLFRQANGGTLLLDEIGELPIDVQPKLLRALAEQRIKSVGSNSYRPVSVRVIAATRRDLVREVNAGTFRSDLYFRVAQLRIELPALRERTEDIPALVRKMITDLGDPSAYGRITNDSLERLMRHDWPGNVRELRNVIAVALAFGKDGPIDLASHLTPMSSAASESTSTRGRTFQDAKREVLARFEREYFTSLYAECNGNVSEIGRRAAMERAHVRGYLRRHGIGDPKKSSEL